jgi:uncharacterized protein
MKSSLLAAIAALSLLSAVACLAESVGKPSFQQTFPPGAVRLLEGPFKAMQDADHAYLIRLEPDRLLALFRLEAGLEPRAKPYGGWESPAQPGKTWSLAGHSLGHYLTAASLMYRMTDDHRLRERVEHIVRELKECQDKRGDGSLVAFPYARELEADIRDGKVETVDKYWAPFYTIHKELAGLRDAWLLCGDPNAREVMVRLADWCGGLVKGLSEEQRERLLQMEHGGMAEALADVYAITAESRHLDFARLYSHRELMAPLAEGKDTLTGKHANTQIPKFTGFQRIHELAGDAQAGAAAEFFWRTVVESRTWVNGGNSIHEHFPAPENMVEHITHEGGPETCNTYNMLRLTTALHRAKPSAAHLDYYENALFNHILASQAPLAGAGAFVYYTPLRPQYARSYGTDFHSFWCCTGTGMENHARYGELIYSHDSRALSVNLFMASELTWPERGLVLRQETRFPDESAATLVIVQAPAEPITLRIRHPSWLAAQRFGLRVNGQRINANTQPGGFAEITRQWTPGDRVRVNLSMNLRVVRQASTPGWVSIFYGPILLAGELGSEGLTRADYFGSYTPAKALMPSARAPVFAAETDGQILERIVPVPGRTVTFRTEGLVKPEDVTLSPFFRLHFQRYAFYWQLTDEGSWEQQQRELARAERQEREIEARTVDRVRIGEQQPEIDHNLQFENSHSGAGPHNRRWRDARNGGWFSYELRLPPEGQPSALRVLYWGADRGREFDIQLDGHLIATQKLDGRKDGFFAIEYEIPKALAAGKQKVTARFQCAPGGIAGGIFDLRMVTLPIQRAAVLTDQPEGGLASKRLSGGFEPVASGSSHQVSQDRPAANLALVASSSTSHVSGHETITALNDGSNPAHSNDKSAGAYGNWPRAGTQWVQYDWPLPVQTGQIEVYWFDDQRGVRLPVACRLSYWDGTSFIPVPGAAGLGLGANQFNVTTFPAITTTKLRLEFDSLETFSTGILEWRVLDAGGSPNFPPTVDAGVDRVVILPGQTYLEGRVRDDGKPNPVPAVQWRKESGPGAVEFEDATALATSARFSALGEYKLQLAANDGQSESAASLNVTVAAAPPAQPLAAVPTTAYKLSGPFWPARAKAIIVNWIPHCIRMIEDPNTKEGGIQNFAEAGRKLAGANDARHVGAVFANTWVYNTLESICLALMLDAQGDAEILRAQAAMRKTLEDWIPKMLSAQEPDGYLHTMYTIQGQPRWSNKHDHEDYQAGYFIEAAIAHWQLTNGKDRRMYDAARRLADCWARNLGPAGNRQWFPGHQALEMALVRLADLAQITEGPDSGREYVALAKWLLDQRQNGEEYDQSHLPVTRQYEAVGHAVRAVYSYAGMADIAIATADVDYHSAVKSLWNSIVNRKYYVTGGIGSGETSEGFGRDYSLPQNAYSESCAGSGMLFFQHRMNRACHHARYADLYEETLYNVILGGLDLDGQNFTYTNPLDSSQARYKWHVCPCCVGNLPRTLLQLPTWTYTQSADTLHVNLFVGGTVTLANLGGVPVRLVQDTGYPWTGKVALELHPAAPARFTLKVRVPNRHTSELYSSTPSLPGLLSLKLNGQSLTPPLDRGYAVIERSWQPGDRIEWEVPLQVQRIKATEKIAATRGRAALRYGPLIYNFESVDQSLDSILAPGAPLSAEWEDDLLGGVMVIRGQFADGSPLLAIPNYARLNRGGRSIVWIRSQ